MTVINGSHGEWPVVVDSDPGEAGQVYQGISAPISFGIKCPCTDGCPACPEDEFGQDPDD